MAPFEKRFYFLVLTARVTGANAFGDVLRGYYVRQHTCVVSAILLLVESVTKTESLFKLNIYVSLEVLSLDRHCGAHKISLGLAVIIAY